MRYLLATLLAVAIVALLEGVRQLYRWWEEKRRDELRRRLQTLGQADVGGTLLRDQRLARSEILDDMLRGFPPALWLEKLLEQTDYDFSVAQVMSWSMLGGAAGFLGGLFLFGPSGFAVLLALATAFVPTLLLTLSRKRRSNAISEQLPEALDMLARSLRAGHALSSAFEVVAKEMPPPVAVEFGRVFEAQRLGVTLEHALIEMTRRVPHNGDVEMLTVSVTIQRETGGNLAEIFANLAETIRARYRFYGKLRGLTAEGRASALVLGVLPFVVAAVLSVTSPHYLDPLVTTSTGRVVLAYAIGSWALGLLWLKRMTVLDY